MIGEIEFNNYILIILSRHKGYQMRLKIIVIVLLLGVLSSACIGATTDIQQLAKAIPDVKAFLDENPNADIKAVLWEESSVNESIESIREACGSQFRVNEYYKIDVSDGRNNLVVWYDTTSNKAICILRKGVQEKPQDDELLKEQPKESEKKPDVPPDKPEEKPEPPKDEKPRADKKTCSPDNTCIAGSIEEAEKIRQCNITEKSEYCPATCDDGNQFTVDYFDFDEQQCKSVHKYAYLHDDVCTREDSPSCLDGSFEEATDRNGCGGAGSPSCSSGWICYTPPKTQDCPKNCNDNNIFTVDYFDFDNNRCVNHPHFVAGTVGETVSNGQISVKVTSVWYDNSTQNPSEFKNFGFHLELTVLKPIYENDDADILYPQLLMFETKNGQPLDAGGMSGPANPGRVNLPMKSGESGEWTSWKVDLRNDAEVSKIFFYHPHNKKGTNHPAIIINLPEQIDFCDGCWNSYD